MIEIAAIQKIILFLHSIVSQIPSLDLNPERSKSNLKDRVLNRKRSWPRARKRQSEPEGQRQNQKSRDRADN